MRWLTPEGAEYVRARGLCAAKSREWTGILMVNRPKMFRQTDLKRALRAAKQAGLEVGQVELDPVTGRIIITASSEIGGKTSTPLDDWLATHAHSS